MAKAKGSPKTGGRKAGTPNKRTQFMAQLAEAGIDPLEFMFSVMRDTEADKHLRCDMAKTLARYYYAWKQDDGISMNINGQGLNGKGNGAEHEGITVRFVRPSHVGDD